MPYSKQQAESALNDVDRAERRAAVLRGYERGAPHCILWGLIWIVGYGLSDVLAQWSGLIWMFLTVCGMLGGYLIGRTAKRRNASASSGWRYPALGAALLIFMFATYYVMAPRTGAQLGAFPPLVIAFVYVLVGIWRGSRWILAGIAIGALTVIGFGFLNEHFMLWMAFVGGSALILTGLWLRRA